MSGQDGCKGCEEYRGMTRRRFVGLTAGAAAASLAPGWLPRVVYAQSENSARDAIVSIFLRGGADALTLCVPHGERAYYDLRPELAVPPPDSSDPGRALDLDGFFGLPPALAPLRDAYADGSLLIVHACGLENPTRSHFEAMRFIEAGMGDAPGSLATGWLGRHLQVTAPSDREAALRAVGIGFGLPRTLAGAPLALPIADLADFGFEGRRKTGAERRAALEAMYAEIGDPLRASAENTFRTVDTLRRIGFRGYVPSGGASYPDGDFGYALRSTAALLKAEVGVEAVAIDLGGWDTHDFQGPLDGWMAYLMELLGQGLAAFHQDLFSSGMERFALVVMSEFGRNAFENASRGTDHGHAGLMLALGGGIQGGRVLTEWPGLEREQLYEEQDLQVAIDYRDVLTEILRKRAANSNAAALFPDPSFTPTEHGVAV